MRHTPAASVVPQYTTKKTELHSDNHWPLFPMVTATILQINRKQDPSPGIQPQGSTAAAVAGVSLQRPPGSKSPPCLLLPTLIPPPPLPSVKKVKTQIH